MWSTINHFFDKLDYQEPDNAESIIYSCSIGAPFSVIRYEVYRDLYKLNKIYLTFFNTPVICINIVPTRTFEEAQTLSHYIDLDDRKNWFKTYGPFDYLKFMPICSVVFFKYQSKNHRHLTDVGLIYKDEYFLYDEFDKPDHNYLKNTNYFSLSDDFLFIPIPINYNNALTVYNYNVTKLQFILAATNFVPVLFNDRHRLIRDRLNYYSVNDLLTLRALLYNNQIVYKNLI